MAFSNYPHLAFRLRMNGFVVSWYSYNLIPELRNTAYSCSQHGPATARLTSERPGEVILVPKTFTPLLVYIACRNVVPGRVTKLQGQSIKQNVLLRNTALNLLTIHFTPLAKSSCRLLWMNQLTPSCEANSSSASPNPPAFQETEGSLPH